MSVRVLGASFLLWGITLGLAASPASAIGFGFSCVTGNSAADCAIGEEQISVDVSDSGGGGVLFAFLNVGSAASSITDVYFDDGALLRISTILGGVGVSFSHQATPAELPGAQWVSPPFQTTAGFSADSTAPVQQSGVNPGESLVIVFELVAGATWLDVLSQLTSGALRIGVHVQGYASGGSESLVSVPEPASALLLSLGLTAISFTRRRRSPATGVRHGRVTETR